MNAMRMSLLPPAARILPVCLLALVLGAARSLRADPQPSAADAASESSRRAQAVATFANGHISVGELEDAILEQSPIMQQRYLSRAAVKAVLDRSLRFELLAAEAERKGYAANPDVVLAQQKAAVQALIKAEFDDKISPQAISEQDLRTYYAAHKDEFARGETRRASVLIAKDEAAGQALLARARAADLRAFRELVRSESVDQTNKQRGGDLSYFDSEGRLADDEGGRVDPVIAKAAFALRNVGDTSELIQLGEQRGIVRLTGLSPAQEESFAKVQEMLRMRLWRERRQTAIDAHLAALKQQLSVRVHPELVDVVQLDTGPALPPNDGLPRGFPHIRAETQSDAAHTGQPPR